VLAKVTKRFLALAVLVGMLSGLISSPANAAVINGQFACTGGGTFTVSNSVLLENSSWDCSGAALIPDGVTSIEESAFEEAEELTSVTIPASVTIIGEMAFVWAYELGEFVVAPGNAYFKSVDGVLFTKSGGTLLRYPMSKATPYVIPPSVTIIGNNAFTSVNLGSITIPSGVTRIGDYAFADCGLTSINIPDKVSTIGDGAFAGNLITEFTVDARNASFKTDGGVIFTKNGDTLLNYPVSKAGSYEVPTSVIRIASGAFAQASALSSVVISASVVTIGDNAFRGAGLNSVTFASNSQLTGIGEFAFDSAGPITSISIPAKVTSIGRDAFQNLSSLRTVTFAPNIKLTSIGDNVFGGATSLESISIPASVTSIGDFAFSGASSLTSLTFASNSTLTSIGSGAFAYARSLGSVVIPATVVTIKDGAFRQDEAVVNALTSITFAPNSQLTTIGDSAFRNVNALTNITIPANVKTIGEYAFANWNYDLSAPMALTTVTFEAGGQLERIERGAFQHQRSLSQITIPASVTSIGDNAFQWNRRLTSLSFESGSKLRSIGSYAFENARLLTNITLPASVTSIGDQAFGFTYALNSVSFESGSQLRSIGRAAFESAGILSTITIPAGVTSIGDRAIRNLNPDSTVYFLGNAPTDIESNSFLQGVNAYVSNCATGFTADGNGKWNGLVVNVVASSNPCLAVYDLDGGFGVTTGYLGIDGKVASEPTPPTRSGYAFTGWSATKGGPVVTFPYGANGSSNLTLFAKWLGNTNIVTYDSTGGTAVEPTTFVTGGQIAAAPTPPTLKNYVFTGWFDRGEAVNFPYTPSAVSDLTLYAGWRYSPNETPTTPVVQPTTKPTVKPTTKPVVKSTPTLKPKTSPIPKFAAGASSLSKSGKTALQKIVKKSDSGAIYTITGAASKSPGVPNRFVKGLAMARAEKVKAQLIKLGVKKSKIVIKIKITESRVAPQTTIKVSK
jgi:uncharacterized repeat protein (TIGR02543 family)